MITFSRFREEVEPAIKDKAEQFKRAVIRQMKLLGKPETGKGHNDWIADAFESANITYKGSFHNLASSLSKGRGATIGAIAIYYWLYCDRRRAEVAYAIDMLIFDRERYFASHFRYDTPVVDPIEVLAEIFAGEPIADRLNVERLRRFFDTYTISEQLYPCVLLLLLEVENILSSKEARIGPGQELASFRNVCDQQFWIDLRLAEQPSYMPADWTYKGIPVLEHKDGANFILIREDGSRVSSDALHKMNSWFLKVWELRDRDVFDDDALDLFLKYILTFCGFGRSDWFKFYFTEPDRLHAVFEASVRRARKLRFRTRTYGHLDPLYERILNR